MRASSGSAGRLTCAQLGWAEGSTPSGILGPSHVFLDTFVCVLCVRVVRILTSTSRNNVVLADLRNEIGVGGGSTHL